MARQDDFGGSMGVVLAALRAAAEGTRLRVLALCAEAELSVTELVAILGQSQPRVSRHLKVLTEAGLLERLPEGNWVFFRLADDNPAATALRAMIGDLAGSDPALALDRRRLKAVRDARAREAAEYFSENARRWDEIRSLHVDETAVEAALLSLLPKGPVGDLLDIGTGTGRVLSLAAARAQRAVGIDLSHDMLTVARANLERAGLGHCHVRHGDMYQLPWPRDSFDVVTIHQVLHFAEAPGDVLAEAARVLRPGGTLAVVDFAPHGLEYLRADHAHRRLGFSERELRGWFRAAGLKPQRVRALAGDPLTVIVATASRAAVKAVHAELENVS